MSSKAFRYLLLSLFLAMTGLSSAFAQPTLNGASCTSASVTYGAAGAIAITTVGCGGSTLTGPSFTSGVPSGGSLGVAYSFQFSASGNPTPTYSIVSGTQPTGLTINSSTGVLSGTPTAAGTFNFAVQATNSQGSALSPASSTHSVVIATVPPVISSAAPLAATPTIAYSHTFTASQAVIANGWTVSSGALPGWATLNQNTGVLSGTPASGDITTTNFSVVATSANGASTPQAVALAVNPPTLPAITGTPPATATVNTAYNFTFGVTGTAPITWTVTGGTNPPTGLTVSNAGVLSWNPGAAGTYTYRVTANNIAGPAAAPSASTFFTVVVSAVGIGTRDTSGALIPDPSKIASVNPSPHSGSANGAGALYAYPVNPARCNNTTPAISSSWHHNIDFTNHRNQGKLDYFDMAANESLTYEFTPTNADIADGWFSIGTTTQYPTPANFISISTTPCDFSLSKLANADLCYAAGLNDNLLYYSVTHSTANTGTCKMTPGTKYYFNLRWQNAKPGANNTVDSCAAINFSRCGAYVQIR